MTIDEFWIWFLDNQAKLETSAPSYAAELVSSRLREVDSRLGAEVSMDEDVHEIIVTAYRDKDAFPVVTDLVSASPQRKGWLIRALKPSLGFDFELDSPAGPLHADELFFDPLECASGTGRLGIRIYIDNKFVGLTGLKDLVWLVIETGIGEQNASKIHHLEVAANTVAAKDALPISDLGSFLAWREQNGVNGRNEF